jgi:hypothetical protein
MPHRSRRKCVILSQAIACEARVRRVLSLSPTGTEFRSNLITAGSQSTPAVAVNIAEDPLEALVW